MGVRILFGDSEDGTEKAALYDSVTGFAFGPTFESREQAQRFLDFAETWLRCSFGRLDLRELEDKELTEIHGHFLKVWRGEDLL